MKYQSYYTKLLMILCFTADNGLNPVWTKASTDFDIECPDLALIRFVVQDEDVFGEPNFLGQATFPVKCLRSGIYLCRDL